MRKRFADFINNIPKTTVVIEQQDFGKALKDASFCGY
jgi:hypothetical protein